MVNSFILSGLPCSGKTTLAKKLSEHYGGGHHGGHYEWPVYSIGDLWREKWKERFPNEEVSFEDFWRATSLEENRNMNLEAVKIFKKGQVIADTRYAIYANDLPSFRVFVTAPLVVRALRAHRSGKYKGSIEQIENTLLKREEDELKTGKNLIDESYDYRNPNNYHLVINSGLLTVHEELSLIVNRRF